MSRIRVRSTALKYRVKCVLPPLPWRGHTVNRVIVPSAAARQDAEDHELLAEDIQLEPLHRFNVVVAGHWNSAAHAFFSGHKSGHKSGVSSNFNSNMESLSRASNTRQALTGPSNSPNVFQGVIGSIIRNASK
jgi:hypothetical protein